MRSELLPNGIDDLTDAVEDFIHGAQTVDVGEFSLFGVKVRDDGRLFVIYFDTVADHLLRSVVRSPGLFAPEQDAFYQLLFGNVHVDHDIDLQPLFDRMQIAAYYGGLAITASGTTAVHALSYPLGGKYHIAHGVSNAILLAPVMRFNSEHPAVKERLAVAYDRCCHENKTCTTVEEKAAWMIARLEAIVKHLDIPTSLKEFGVPAEDLEGLVESGMQVQRLLVNNMRPVTADDARKLYQEIM